MQFFCIQCFYRLIRLYNKVFYNSSATSLRKVSTEHIPWLWIGAELTSGKIITLTEVVNSSIEYGDTIDQFFLEQTSGYSDVNKWLYLDPKTLKEEEIPAEGLVIEDDSDE